MVIEHSFVTTLDSTTALHAAWEMLVTAGFETPPGAAFMVGQDQWTSLQMKRGKKSARGSKDPTQCPQQLLLEWDRGLVTVAGSIEPRAYQRSFFASGTAIGAATISPRMAKRLTDYTELMTAVEEALELRLANQLEPDQASEAWLKFEKQLQEKYQKARRRRLILATVFVVVIVLACVAIVLANSR